MRCWQKSTELSKPQSLQRFENNQRVDDGSNKLLPILWRYLTLRVAEKTPSLALPLQQPDLSGTDDLLIKLGHSTVLLRLSGLYVLTDPVFGERASPLPFAGPKRFHAMPLSIEQLPALDAVLISHDHYDHLDKPSVQALAAKTSMFIVPTGVDRHLRRFGVPAEKITVLSWWQHTQLGPHRIHATPAQHFSGRSLFDRNQSLWASFVIESAAGQRLFFSGDSGYFAGFAEIGRAFGGFDLSMMETGAYDELWPDIHMQPEQSLRAHLDLGAKYLLPIHNSTFDLAMHAWFEPLQRLATASDAYQAQLLTPQFGQTLKLATLDLEFGKNQRWWQALMPVNQSQDEVLVPL